ncbi:MAG TPA: TOMM precursor leader peptide-binding protein [Pyrinomonadaceae bacterium]|nr:TOMM precursor leader peptide-binding protein [Pyrinomonadaceae bacterium]
MEHTNHQKLVLAHRLTPFVQSDDTLLLVSEDGAVTLQGRIFVDVAQSLVHGVTREELHERLGDVYSSEDLSASLEVFVAGGLTGVPSTAPRATIAYWEDLNITPATGPIAVVNLCGPQGESIIDAVEANGLRISPDAERVLAITDDYLRPELEVVAEQQLDWLLAKPIGHTIWIGPVFGKEESVCWRCLAHRLRTNRWEQAAIYGCDEQSFPPQPSIASLPGTSMLAAGLIATTTALWMAAGTHPELQGRILTFDTRTLRAAAHVVHPLPACTQCRRQPLPPALNEWVSPHTGIISNLEITEAPVFGFFQAKAAQVQPLPKLGRRELLQPIWVLGKGTNAQDAQLSCLGEAIERYSIVYQGDERTTRGTLTEVDGVSPESLLLFSERQYETRESWNRTHSELHWVPQKLDPVRPINWTEARDLLTGAKRYLPTGYCYLRYPFVDEPVYASSDSNGCAAGSTLSDAIFHGLLELVERDALAIWWYNRLSRPAVDLESFGEPKLLDICKELQEVGRNLYLLDVTNDLGVPVYVATAPKFDGSSLHFAAAAHPDPRMAALRSVAELTQSLHCDTLLLYDELRLWLETATLANQKYFEPASVQAAPRVHVGSVAHETRRIAARIEERGMRVYYLDLTRPEVGVPVARVVAPGLRYFWARLGSGRLYDVPVQLGWSHSSLSEEDVNPIPCMI